MNKKLTLYVLTLAFTLFLIFSATVHAQNTSSYAPTGMPTPQPFGQTHAYTVTLRGNQEAVVSMKAIFTNYEEATMSAMTFQVPAGEIKGISAYQVIREPQCIQYDYSLEKTTLQVDQRIIKPQEPKCLQYSEPNYYEYYYGNTKYMKADVRFEANTITVQLAKGIDPQKSGSLVLYYRAIGYVTKDSFGAMKYSFETLKTDSTIRALTVGINTDTDLVLEGTDEKVNYETAAAGSPMLAADRGMSQASFASPEFDSYYQQIGYGRITKSTADLQPFDSFTVEGRYAKSKMQLYGKSIVLGVLIIAGIILIVVALLYRLIRSFTKKPVVTTAKNTVPVQSTGHTILIMLVAGLLSSVFAAIYTICIYVMFTMLDRMYYSQLNTIVMLFVALISCVVYILLIFGPAVLVGWKRGVWWGIGTVLTTVLLLCIYLGFFMIYLFMSRQQPIYPSPIYMNSAPASQSVYMK